MIKFSTLPIGVSFKHTDIFGDVFFGRKINEDTAELDIAGAKVKFRMEGDDDVEQKHTTHKQQCT